jgi:hypothetical protein
MIRVGARTGLVRLASLAALLGLLVQTALGLPLALRMATDPAVICSASHTGGDPPVLPHDHAHCLLCQNGTVPPLLPGLATLPAPTALALAAPPVLAQPASLPPGRRTPFIPRAPPSLA